MIFKITKTGDRYKSKPKPRPCDEAFLINKQWNIQIASLNELVELQKEMAYPLIIDYENIEIYDMNRE